MFRFFKKKDNGVKVTVTRIKVDPNKCICDLIREGVITSGWCQEHHTDWT